MRNQFNNKVVLITGGASGIGKSLAEQLGALGARVIIIGRSIEKGEKQAEKMRLGGNDVVFKQQDMTESAGAKKLFDQVMDEYGSIDYVFNNAGIFMAGEIRDTPIDDWRKVVDNNIWAVNNGAHYAYQHMLKQGSGHIVNVASAAGLFPVPIMGIYGSSKFAIVGLSHALRNEAKKLGIKVSVVCPTVVNTPLYDTAIYEKVNKSKVLKSRNSLQTAEVAAKRIIKGVMKNKATIHTAFSTKVGWFSYRYASFLYNLFAQKIIISYRKSLRKI